MAMMPLLYLTLACQRRSLSLSDALQDGGPVWVPAPVNMRLTRSEQALELVDSITFFDALAQLLMCGTGWLIVAGLGWLAVTVPINQLRERRFTWEDLVVPVVVGGFALLVAVPVAYMTNAGFSQVNARFDLDRRALVLTEDRLVGDRSDVLPMAGMVLVVAEESVAPSGQGPDVMLRLYAKDGRSVLLVGDYPTFDRAGVDGGALGEALDIPFERR